MAKTVEERLAALELATHDQARDLKYLDKSHKEIINDVHGARTDLDKIFKLINQIRWMVAGALVLALVNKFGVMAILTKAFGF